MEELLKVLAEALGVRNTEAEVIAAVKDSASLRAELRQHVSADQDTTKVLLGAVKKVVADNGDTSERLIALTRALAVKDGDDPVTRITTLLKAETDLEALKPEFETLKAEAKKAEDVRIENEVDTAIRVHSLGAQVRDALILFRRSDKKSFDEKFPLPAKKDEHLTQVMATSTRGANEAVPQQAQAAQQNSNVIDLKKYAGVNDSERMEQHILATNPSAVNWDRQKLYTEVNRLRALQVGGN